MKKFIRYLDGSKELGLRISRTALYLISAWLDADLCVDLEKRRSRGIYYHYWGQYSDPER